MLFVTTALIMLRSGIKNVSIIQNASTIKKTKKKLTSPRCSSLTLKQEHDDF